MTIKLYFIKARRAYTNTGIAYLPSSIKVEPPGIEPGSDDRAHSLLRV